MENNEQKIESGSSMAQSRTMLVLVAIIVFGTIVYFIGSDELKNKYLTPDRTIATVNGEIITQKQFDHLFEQAKPIYESEGANLTQSDELLKYKSQFLDEMINNAILLQSAKSYGVVVTDYEIKSAYNDSVDRFKGEEALVAYLKEQDMTPEDLKQNISDQLHIQKYLVEATDIEKATVTDTEIKELYEKVVNEMKGEAPEFEKAQALIRSELLRQKTTAIVTSHVLSLREKAVIEKSI